jgi:3-deoxy-D-manno-octulosonic-acid transferase
LGKAMVFGPNMQNFAEMVSSFLKGRGAVQVRDAEELENVFAELLASEARRRELGENAVKVVRENLGAIDRTVEMILSHLEGGELYIAPGK